MPKNTSKPSHADLLAMERRIQRAMNCSNTRPEFLDKLEREYADALTRLSQLDAGGQLRSIRRRIDCLLRDLASDQLAALDAVTRQQLTVHAQLAKHALDSVADPDAEPTVIRVAV